MTDLFSIKPLAFEPLGSGRFGIIRAMTGLGSYHYSVGPYPDGTWYWGQNFTGVTCGCASPEDGKAKCEADWRERITAALLPASVDQKEKGGEWNAAIDAAANIADQYGRGPDSRDQSRPSDAETAWVTKGDIAWAVAGFIQRAILNLKRSEAALLLHEGAGDASAALKRETEVG